MTPLHDEVPMLRSLLLAAALLAAVPAQAQVLRRCGWYNNPTPGNVFLKDADGFWTISRQGTPPAPGFEDLYSPEFDNRERVVTNGSSYGYSCACVDGVYGPVGSEQVISIRRLKALPLSQCQDDPKLPDSPYYGE
jgi:Protein of unknown function (DUF4087)